MTAREVHPVADLFPMLSADELDELAADIKARGLAQPIVLDAEGRILDGRNRLAACEIAGVTPDFEVYDGPDPDGYALAVNVTRRHLRPSQRYVLIEQARRMAKNPKSGFSKAERNGLSEAATVLDFAPDLADAVVAGALSLQTAAETARERKREASEIKAKKVRLSKAAPDLADQVDDGRLDLDEALGALDVREQRSQQEAENARREAEARASEDDRARRVAEQERQESLERDRDRIRAVINGWGSVQLIMREPDSGRVLDIVDGLMPGDQKELTAILAEVTGGAQA